MIETPEVKRRRLKGALRHERDVLHLTQKDVADALNWSVSKIIRIEAGSVGVTATDLRALLDLYKIADERRRAELLELARGSTRESWSEYRAVYSTAARTLFAYEAAARIIYKYEPTFIPGLLQTEEYATALLYGTGHGEAEVERMVLARLKRQALLEQDRRPELSFIIGEAAVSRAVGGRNVMRHQLERLKEYAARSRIILQLLPFDVGVHPRMGEAFTILQFADEQLDDLLYLENAGRESVGFEDPDLAAEYMRDFFRLQETALPSKEFDAAIDRIIATRLAGAASSRKTNDAGQGSSP